VQARAVAACGRIAPAHYAFMATAGGLARHIRTPCCLSNERTRPEFQAQNGGHVEAQQHV